MAAVAAGWGLGAGAETGPEAANLVTWAGESGRGSARRKTPGAERRGRQNFRNSVFQKSGPSEIFGERLRCPPTRDVEHIRV